MIYCTLCHVCFQDSVRLQHMYARAKTIIKTTLVTTLFEPNFVPLLQVKYTFLAMLVFKNGLIGAYYFQSINSECVHVLEKQLLQEHC